MERSTEEIVNDLVRSAQLNGSFDYTQTLLRVGGFETGDPFEDFRRHVGKSEFDYCHWCGRPEFLEFMWNLLKSSRRQRFNSFPFSEWTKPLGEPEPTDAKIARVRALKDLAEDTGWPEVAGLIAAAYPPQALRQCAAQGGEVPTAETVKALRLLNEALLASSDRERHKLGEMAGFYRWPRFEVMEILADDDIGLFGYRVHFSNGNFAEYTRRAEGATALNMSFERNGTPNYFVGSLDELRKEWRVGSRRLHEVGLPGRYNAPGEWKPLVYEGPFDEIQREIAGITSDPDVAGALLYVYTTAFWVVEFVARADVDLPIDNEVRFGSEEHPIRLWKVPVSEEAELSNGRVYDGWTSISEPTEEAIQLALTHIRIGMSRLAFAFDSHLTWTLKYTARARAGALACPEKKDIQRFDELLTTPVPAALDLAVSWYNSGTSSSDPFTSFLCYFNAIEAVVEGAWEGDVAVPYAALQRGSKSERKALRVECIRSLYESLFPEEPNRFAQEVYFNCLKGLAKRRRDVAEAVWGAGDPAVSDLFEADDEGMSLSEVRNLVAHGRLSALDPDDVRLVETRVGRVAELAKALVLRVLLKKEPGDSVELWSSQFKLRMSMSDPRATLICNTLSMMPIDDWTIRPEWVG